MDEIRILLLEDNPFDANIVERHLLKKRMKFVSMRVDEQDEYINALVKFVPDVILSDHSVTEFNSLTAHSIAKKLRPEALFIVVTGNSTEELAGQCLVNGADDFLPKDGLQRLHLAIKSGLDKKMVENEYQSLQELKHEIKKRNEEIKKAAKDKDKFMALVSHEMINHVSSMKMGVRLLESSTRKYGQRHWAYINSLTKSTNSMDRFIGNHLAADCIQKGVIKPLLSNAEVATVVKDVLKRNEDTAAGKNVEICFTNTCKDAAFRTDASYVDSIADTLVSNAIKYTHPGKQVYVKLYKSLGKYRLEVKDGGKQINGHNPYSMLEQKINGNPMAARPGISTVRHLAGALKATVECKSATGRGTTFTVSF